jgi:hypothetical protein
LSQEFFDDDVQNIYERFLRERGLEDFLSNGGYIPLSAAFVAETTRFREFGPLSGYTFRLSVDYSPPVKDTWVSRVIYEGDLRKYIRVTNRSLIAGRLRGFYTEGDDPVIFSYGGGLDIRGFDFREIAGQKGGISNLEYRFPMFPNPRVPFLGQLRAKAFFDYFRIDYLNDALGNVSFPNFATKHVDGKLFLLDFAEGFTFYAGGLPLNFDFSKVFGKGRIADENGIVDLRQPLSDYTITDHIQFDFSIGYDF